MAILLLADHDNATLSDQTAKALTAATKIASGTGRCACAGGWQGRQACS
jgi:hypothetical protein